MALRTDYKDDILDLTQNTQRKYRMITNADGTVSFQDVTVYSQVGDSFGAFELNQIANVVNEGSGNIDYFPDEDMIKIKDANGVWHDYASGGLQIFDVNTIAVEDWDSNYSATYITPSLSLNPFTISAINANGSWQLGVKYTSKNSYDLSGYRYLCIAGSAVNQGTSASGSLGTNPTGYIAILSEETGTLTKLKDFDVKVTGSLDYSFNENIALSQLSGRYKIVVVGSATGGTTGVLTLNSFKFSANEIL